MKEAITKMTNSIAMSQEADGSWHKETYSSLQATAYAWTSYVVRLSRMSLP